MAATVPLTSGIIGYIYGIKFRRTLYGIVFLSHQIGSFVGVWLGGVFYDIMVVMICVVGWNRSRCFSAIITCL